MSELSASILLTLRDEVSQRTKAIVARINELESQIKQGGDVGAAAAIELRQQFELLSASTRESEQVSRRFAQAQKVLGEATNRTASTVGASANVQRQAGSAISFVSKESKNQGREIGGLVNVFAELGYSVGSAVPGMQQVGTQLAIMGGTAYQLGAAFGVAGAAIGVASGLFPTLISFFAGAAREVQGLKRNIDETIESYDSLISQIRRQQQFEEQQQAIERGQADVQTQRAAAEAARRRERTEGLAPASEITRQAILEQEGTVGIGAELRQALETAFRQSPTASSDEVVSSAAVQEVAERLARSRARQAGRADDEGAVEAERSRIEEQARAAARNVINFADGEYQYVDEQGETQTRRTSRSASLQRLQQLRSEREVAERGLAIAEQSDRERRRRANESEAVDLRLAGSVAEAETARRGLLGLTGDARLGRRAQERVEQRIRDGSVTERDARRVGGDEGLAFLDALRSATQEQEQFQAERARIDAEERERRLAEIAATERAASAMERAAEAMERAGASGAATPARQRPAYGQGAELGGAS